MNEEKIHLKIIRLFSGQATKKEKEQIDDWLNQSEENKKLYEDLREIWLSSGLKNNPDHYDLDRAVRSFQSKIRQSRFAKSPKIRFLQFSKYAAVALLILSLPLFYWLGAQKVFNSPSYTNISCAYGDRTNITLPDGTKVWLNSGSKLSFNNNFQTEGRKVKLEGEAFFSVKKDKRHPFKINAQDVEVTVLGTKFDLKAYPDESTVSATLVEGSLQVKSKSQKTIIKPNEKVVYSKDTHKLSLQKLADTAPETEWVDGRMVFRNESLGELELKLERWFDVDINFADKKVKQLRFTGTLDRESILETLTYFDYSPHLAYKVNGNEITFYSK